MNHFRIPNKKPRLEDTSNDWDFSLAGNDDLWGQTELTAEEFDMLEVQATQIVSYSKPSTSRHHVHSSVASTSEESKTNSFGNVFDPEELKQQQYALEGKVKFLHESLSKANKDLIDERLNRENVIADRIEQIKSREQVLQKEIEKLQTTLQFKEQEMKHARKVHLLEQKAKEEVKNSDIQFSMQPPQFSPSKKRASTFLNRFNFESKDEVKTNDASIQTIEKIKRKEVHQLSLWAPQGEPKGADIVSNLLSNRHENVNSRIYLPPLNFSNEAFSEVIPTNELQSIFFPMAKLNAGHLTEDLWECYEFSLREHIGFLQSDVINQKLAQSISEKTKNTDLQQSTSSQSPLQTIEIDTQHSNIISCLKDLTNLLCSQCPVENTSSKTATKAKTTCRYRDDIDFTACSYPLFSCEDEKMDTIQPSLPSLQELLIMLTKPNTYPEGYCKEDEILHALRALAAWSSRIPTILEPHLYDFHLYALLSGQLGINSTYLTLHLLCNIITLDSFLPSLMHRIDGCIFSGIGCLCNSDILTSDNNISSLVIIQVEDFLCEVFAVLGFGIINDDSCSCSSQLIQGFILMLWKHYKLYFKNFSSLQLSALKKGIIVLLQMVTHVEHFREKRVHVEDNYVTLICGLSRLCKENSEIREFQDTVHDLWDFQDDSSEYDMDDQLSTDSQPSTSCDY